MSIPVAVLDIGTTKTVAVIAEAADQGCAPRRRHGAE